MPLEKLIAEEKKRAVKSIADGDGDNNEEHKPAVAVKLENVKVKLENNEEDVDADADADVDNDDDVDADTDDDGLTHTPAINQDRKRSRSVPRMSPRSKRQQKWMDRFKELKTYKKAHGHCNVPQRYSGGLGYWVHRQRRNYNKTERLDNDQISRLESIGFVWNVTLLEYQQRWMARFEELKKYKKAHGHCNVPQRYSGGLGGWVNNQRIKYRVAGKLDNDQISRLESSGFEWKPKRGPRVSEQR